MWVVPGQAGRQQADVRAEHRDLPYRSGQFRRREVVAGVQEVQGGAVMGAGRRHTARPPSSLTRTRTAVSAAGWSSLPRNTSSATSQPITALLRSPVILRIDCDR